MPIVGLTDRRAAFPSIGTIRKGAPKPKSGNKPGADLSYFRLVSDDPQANALWASLYPTEEAARAIKVVLPFREIEDNWDAWREHWVKGGLVHRCDGQHVVLQRKDGGYETFKPGTGPECPGKCKQVGRLAVVLPEMRRMASFTVLTTATHDILSISSRLKGYYSLRPNLRGIPFVLKRVLKSVWTTLPDGKRIKTEKWLLEIEPENAWAEAQLGIDRQAAVPSLENELQNGDIPALDAPDWDDEDNPAWRAGEDPDAPEVDAETGEVLDGAELPELPEKWAHLATMELDLDIEAMEWGDFGIAATKDIEGYRHTTHVSHALTTELGSNWGNLLKGHKTVAWEILKQRKEK